MESRDSQHFQPARLVAATRRRIGEAMSELTKKIMSYEQGELTEEEVIDFFQELVDSGLAWNLQGHYGRTAYAMIQEGLVTS